MQTKIQVDTYTIDKSTSDQKAVQSHQTKIYISYDKNVHVKLLVNWVRLCISYTNRETTKMMLLPGCGCLPWRRGFGIPGSKGLVGGYMPTIVWKRDAETVKVHMVKKNVSYYYKYALIFIKKIDFANRKISSGFCLSSSDVKKNILCAKVENVKI